MATSGQLECRTDAVARNEIWVRLPSGGLLDLDVPNGATVPLPPGDVRARADGLARAASRLDGNRLKPRARDAPPLGGPGRAPERPAGSPDDRLTRFYISIYSKL